MADWVGLDFYGLLDYFVEQQTRLSKEHPVLAKPVDCLRVCTYNVHFWLDPHLQPNSRAILDTISTVHADVLVLQEFMLRTRDRFINAAATAMCVKDLENMGYVYHTFTERPAVVDGFLVVIFSKLPLSDISYFPIGGARHAALATVCLPGLQNVSSDNDKANSVDGKDSCAKIRVWGIHLDVSDESERTRMGQIRVLLTAIASSNYQSEWPIVLGDFNALAREGYSEAEWKKIDTHDQLRGVPPITQAMSNFSRFSLSVGAPLPWSASLAAPLSVPTTPASASVSTSPASNSSSLPSSATAAVATCISSVSSCISSLPSSYTPLLTDSFAATRSAPPIVTTWSQRRIDYIFVDQNLSSCSRQSGVVCSAASDHLPVFLDIGVGDLSE